MYTVGIDAGSRALKVVLLKREDKQLIDHWIGEPGTDHRAAVATALPRILAKNNLSMDDVDGVLATGYGRNIQDVTDDTVTEITCHAKGVHHLVADARTVIEIGGQDSKILHLQENGHVNDFAMNDRCAAGTGRFMEIVAERLGIELEELGNVVASDVEPVTISSMCVVFAETEIIGLLAEGVSPASIVSGIQKAVAVRISAMLGRSCRAPVYFTGGVAMISGMQKALEEVLQQPVTVVPTPQITGALGAALIAAERYAG